MIPSDPYAGEREAMVRHQIANRGITGQRLLAAMRAVPRHYFVPLAKQQRAYEDRPLEIGSGQTISQPYMVAKMTELLEVTPQSKVLEVGTGSGYQAAILAELAGEVISVERFENLADSARERLRALEYHNVTVVVGDGTLGWPEHAPYDAIVVTAAAPAIPPSLRSQLALGGRLVCPVGSRDLQQLKVVVREGDDRYFERDSIRCMFVPLVGRDGWSA
ncbi:MAG TPA: protein-L-isoaspartate(D-aspartate) O-methyltransferase [Candidatus Hydrogenedentes bacterium]|nr:protein-L-isoaspartate(D-aspartate) O-methyltransferase [Candidatus Hydrogenedentota bacterium]HQM48096.1 protein-L-isoaspartate(D-aspartate) O-methyltransferase [Candidatus Hydrogenedentota bacterium]